MAPELYRVQMMLLHADKAPDGLPQRVAMRGVDVARQFGARLLELRLATSLARLWRDQGKHAEARDLLAPIHGWFTEGVDMPDLKEAKALLDVLN